MKKEETKQAVTLLSDTQFTVDFLNDLLKYDAERVSDAEFTSSLVQGGRIEIRMKYNRFALAAIQHLSNYTVLSTELTASGRVLLQVGNAFGNIINVIAE